jgi:WD40 repeat protein
MSDPDQPSEPQETPGQSEPLDYDAFLSYTHGDRAAVSGIQKALHRIGRRMGQLRALRVFRDDTDLMANPDLWGRIVDGLNRSRYLIVTLSPQAAQSLWVNKEVSYWLEHRGGERLLLVLADGKLIWDEANARFDPQASDAALSVLTEPESLPVEPLYIDISEDAPWDHRAPAFRDKITALAAPIHDKPKDQLASDDLREQRRFRRLLAAATTGLAVLTVVAVVAALVAVGKQHEANRQRHEAIRQRDQAIALRLATDAQAMLAGLQPGGDIRAFQELVAAEKLGGSAVAGQLHDALIDRISTLKVVQTPAEVNSLALSPDGRRVVTGGADGTARLWDTNTGRPIGQPVTTHRSVGSVAFSTDGTRIAVAGSTGLDADHNVRLWDVRTGKLVGERKGGFQSVSFSPDGRLAAAGTYGTIRIWDASGTTAGELKMSDEQVIVVAFSPDGHRLLSCDGASVALWNADSGQLISRTAPARTDTIGDVAFSPDGNQFATAGDPDDASVVRLWDAHTGQPIGRPLTGHTGPVNGVAFSPDGARLVSVGVDKTVRFWDAKTGAPLGGPLSGHERAIRAVAFSPDGRSVVTGSRDATWRVWNPDAGSIPTHHGTVTTLSFSPDGQWIASGGKDGSVQLRDAQNGKPLRTMTGHAGLVRAMVFSPDGHRLITGGQDDTLRFWNTDTGRLEGAPRDAKQTAVTSLALSRDGHLLASGGNDGSIRLWDADTGQPHGPPLTRGMLIVLDVAFSPDGRRVVSASDGPDGNIQVWESDTMRAAGAPFGPKKGAGNVAFSPDGRLIASGGEDGTVQLWNSDTHQPVGQPMNPYQGRLTDRDNPAVASLAFTPDGDYLVTGGFDGELRMWRADTGRPVGDAVSANSARQLHDVAVRPDGRYAASGGADGTIRLWPLLSPDLLCAKLSTNMSKTQWREWVSPDVPYDAGCPGLAVPD